MSGAILYLAIVAIWAVVLVPRWLRPRPAQPQPAEHLGDPQSGEPQPGEAQPGEPQEAAPEAVAPSPAQPSPAEGQPVMAQPVLAQPADGGSNEPDPGPADAPAWTEDAGPGEPVPAPAAREARRAEIVQARRRLLAMIVVLTAGAVALAVTGIAAYWVVIPPAVLLTGFLVLLRQATRIDAKRARRADRARHTAPDRVAGQEPESLRADAAASPDQAPVTAPAADAAEPPPGAEIIDISGRISDQVYDQYADAADRAVGD